MSNKTHIEELNESWICKHLGGVTDIETQNATWILVQEPGFIGFGVVSPKEICWPPYKESGWEPDWKLVSDLRLFGEKGEWHVWRDWDGKHYARLLELDNINEALTEYHFLWGTKVKCGKSSWIKLVEDRGAEIWIPPLEGTELKDVDLPLRLKLKQVVDYDPDYHLAGIVDAALIALVSKSKKILKPSSSLFSKTSQGEEEVPCRENTESTDNISDS